MTRAALVVLALAACGRKTTDRTCERTIDAAYERVKLEQGKSGVPSAGSAIVAGSRATMIASCEAEKWTDDVLACFETSRLEVDLTACQGKLTHDQWERLQRKLSTLRASLSPPEPPPIVIDAAPPPDAAVDAAPGVVDAMPAVVPPPQPEPPRVVPPVDAAPVEDCSQTIRNARSAKCRQQYCATHASDPRCDVE